MISFDTPQAIEERLAFVRQVARDVMRENARRYDEAERLLRKAVASLLGR